MEKSQNENNIYEQKGINISNESSLHLQLKKWYYKPNDRLEASMDGYVIDIIRNEELIEIQTKNFSSIKKKLTNLLTKYQVTLIHPIAIEKTIIKISNDGKEIKKRKSPAKGSIYDIFDELIRIPELVNNKNLKIEIPMIKMQEIRRNDGKGSWRRKGVSILDKRLLEVVEVIRLNDITDFIKIIPNNSELTLTNKSLSKQLSLSVAKTSKITYCMRKMGIIEQIGKQGNELIFGFKNQ